MSDPLDSNEQNKKEREIAEYLQNNPDFFLRHEALLENLNLPHQHGGKAISLIERQVGLMREQKQTLKKQMQHLTQTAKTNELLLERLQALMLMLIDGKDLHEVLELMNQRLHNDFHADAVEIRLFGEGPGETPLSDPALNHFQSLLSNRRPISGHLRPDQLRFLFSTRAEEIASAVVIPLCDTQNDSCLGLLAIGSVDPKRYHPEMGTLLVNHLGAVTTRILRSHRSN